MKFGQIHFKIVISLLLCCEWRVGQSRFHAPEQRPTKLISPGQVGNIEMQKKINKYEKKTKIQKHEADKPGTNWKYRNAKNTRIRKLPKTPKH